MLGMARPSLQSLPPVQRARLPPPQIVSLCGKGETDCGRLSAQEEVRGQMKKRKDAEEGRYEEGRRALPGPPPAVCPPLPPLPAIGGTPRNPSAL